MALSVLVPLLLFLVREWRPVDRTAVLAGIAFLALTAASISWAVSAPDAVDRLWELTLGAGVFLWGAQVGRRGFAALAIGCGIGIAANSVLAVLQYAEIETGVGVVTRDPAGTFVNANYMAEGAVMAIAALFAAPLAPTLRWGLVLAALPAVLLPSSQGALIGIFAVGATVMARTGHLRTTGLLCAAGAALAGWYTWQHWGSPYFLPTRLPMWINTAASWSWFGYGSGSYLTGYAMIHDTAVPTPSSVFGFLIRPQTAHNDALTVLFEHGVVGLLLAAGFVARVAALGWRRPEIIVPVAALALGLANFPLYNPMPLALFFASCGWICSGQRSSL